MTPPDTESDKSIDTITIFEDWAEIEGAVWYKWRVEGEKNWHWRRTAYKQKPVVYMKRLPREEFNILLKEDNDE